MNRNEKTYRFKRLSAVYKLFDSVIASQQIDFSCQKGCAACCTCNVTLTGLEARYLIRHMSRNDRSRLLPILREAVHHRHYIPKLSTNQFARFCMEGKPLPDEDNDPDWGSCSLLEKEICRIYSHRPFGCRALLSSQDCKRTGYAQIPPFVLTVNNIFVQYIESLDQGGFTGNLVDVLYGILSGQDFGKSGKPANGESKRFVRNERISVLMVPPEHHERVKPLLQQLNQIASIPEG